MSRLSIARSIIIKNNNKFSDISNSTINRTLLGSIIENSCINTNNKFYQTSAKRLNNLKSTEDFIDKNNVYKSIITPFGGSPKYLHEYIWENVDRWADKTALVCSVTGRSYKYGQLKKLCGRLATSFRKNKLQPGDTIAIVAPNVPEFAIVVMAASEAGLQLTLVNPNYTVGEIGKQLLNSESVAVITVPDKYSIVAKSISENSKIRLPIIVIDDGSPMPSTGIINFNDLISDGIQEFEKSGQTIQRRIDYDTFLLPYSSGTTGLPKGVELTHRNVVENLRQQHVREFSFESDIGGHQDIVPVFLPMFHIYSLSLCLLGYLRRGAKLICMPKFSSNALLDVLEKHRTTYFYAVPPVFQLIANDDRFHERHFENVKLSMTGAAPLSIELLSKLMTRFKSDMSMIQGYGLSEAAPAISLSKSAPIETVGYLVPNSIVRIVGCDESNLGKNLGVDEVGEIYIRGPQVMKGYYKNPEATANCIEDDWLKTGDLGSFNKDALLSIRGRLKELIKVQGLQVSPPELEHIIQSHEGVADAAVIGIPHERYGEVPKAFVVPRPNIKMNEQEVKDFVAKQVAKHKQLGHVVFVNQIPKSATGKILRKDLQKM